MKNLKQKIEEIVFASGCMECKGWEIKIFLVFLILSALVLGFLGIYLIINP